MNLQPYIERIEEFMGHEYGELPSLGTEDELFKILFKDSLPVDVELTPEIKELFAPRFEKLKKMFKAAYDSDSHTIFVYGEDTDELTLFHELTHSYAKNHWPGFDKMWTQSKKAKSGDNLALEKLFINQALAEGLADVVALNCAQSCEESEKKYIFYSNPQHRDPSVTLNALKALSIPTVPANEKRILFESITRGVGYNYVEYALRVNEDKHKAYFDVLRHRPKTVLELFC